MLAAMERSGKQLTFLAWGLRVGLGLWFVWSGSQKVFVSGLDRFTQDVANYQMVRSPLDALTASLGVENVAEISGRKTRLRFHTGAPLVADPAEAMFALVADPAGLPRLDTFAQGTDEYPDRSTTLLVALSGLDGGPALTLTGPGIERSLAFAPPVQQPDFWVQWGDNNARYPRGVDLVLAAGGRIAGLPRTTRIGEA